MLHFFSQTTSTFIIIILNGAFQGYFGIVLYCIDRCWNSTSIVVGGSMYMPMYGEILRGILILEINIKYTCLALMTRFSCLRKSSTCDERVNLSSER